jgi:hypothetical protein
MSDIWLTLIPEDPRFVPDAMSLTTARDHLAALAPDAEEIEVITHESIQFFDCGGNFEEVRCPACQATIPTEWWQDRMDDDYDGGFKLSRYATPCCGKMVTLNELVYNWPQGLARAAIRAMNPNIPELNKDQIEELSKIIGGSLRVIYQLI